MSEDEDLIGAQARCGLSNYQNSIWLTMNKLLMGTLFVMSILYIMLFIGVTLYITFFRTEMTNIETLLYCAGFAFCVFSIGIAFIGGTLRSIK